MQHVSGDRHRFAIGFELVDDPDEGPWLRRKSWARLQLWVGDRNLTLGHASSGEAVDAAEVPLWPVLEWLAEVWDPLLHEERLPRPSKATSAASWRADVLARLPSSPAEFDALLDDRHTYWQRHGLGSALPGFRVPDLHVRRSGRGVELSWDDREWRTVPTGVLLAERPGHAVLAAAEVAAVLMDFAEAVLTALAADPTIESEAARQIGALRKKFSQHRSADRHLERLRWLAGVDLDAAARRLRSMAGIVGGDLQDTVRALLGLDVPQAPGLVTEPTIPALLFRSAAPRLSPDDLNVLIRLARESDGSIHSALQALRVAAPLPASATATTADGLERALAVREALSLPLDVPMTGAHDLETVILRDLGVRIREIHLDDAGVDGIAISGPDIAPTIAVNLTGRRARTPWGRRMTLGHELCHLLFDVDAAGRVGIVSNAWADAAAERRANAFAVMLLAPEPALAAVLAREAVERWTRADLETAMTRLGVGLRTLTWQLQNLGWIDNATQEYWLDAFRSP